MRRRSRLVLWLLGAVGLLLVSATPASAATYILHPDSDIQTQWTENPAGPGHERLDDGTTQPTAPPAQDRISSNTSNQVEWVGLDNPPMGPGEAPLIAKAWTYGRGEFGGPAGFTVDLMAGSTVLATANVNPTSNAWRSFMTTSIDAAQVNDLSLRFTNVGWSHVLAAYVELTTVEPPDLPIGPQNYTLPDDCQAPIPANVVCVTNGTELSTALAGSTAKDIILADNTYTTPANSHFVASAGHRLWAQHLGEATLTSGLEFGQWAGSGGGEVHGLEFVVTDPTKATVNPNAPTAMLYAWSPGGDNTKVYDTTFQGDPGADHKIDAGIYSQRPQGAVVERVVVRDVKLWGIRIQRPDFGSPDPDDQFNFPDEAQTIRDIDVDRVAMPTPGSADGTGEAGLWIGAPVANDVERLQLEHGGWMGLWTGGSSKDTTFRDITVSSSDLPGGGFGIYAERRSLGNTYEQFAIGPTNIKTGIACEWDGSIPSTGAYRGCDDSTFQDGTIDSSFIGVSLDDGSRLNEVRRVVFRNQSCAGILDYDASPPPPSTDTYTDNNFLGITDPDAVDIGTFHYLDCP